MSDKKDYLVARKAKLETQRDQAENPSRRRTRLVARIAVIDARIADINTKLGLS